MKKLERNRTEDQYIKEEYVVGKYLYYTASNHDNILYYIFKCEGILSNSPLKYKCSRCYCFSVPKNNEWYPKDEIWFIEYENDEYNIVFTYDCGCAKDEIKNIKYCPLCGRELR